VALKLEARFEPTTSIESRGSATVMAGFATGVETPFKKCVRLVARSR